MAILYPSLGRLSSPSNSRAAPPALWARRGRWRGGPTPCSRPPWSTINGLLIGLWVKKAAMVERLRGGSSGGAHTIVLRTVPWHVTCLWC